MLTVRVENDICVEVVSDHKLRGKFVYWPNSVRRDIRLAFALPERPFVSKEPWEGRNAPDHFYQIGG